LCIVLRKVFISFLGANPYQEARYYDASKPGERKLSARTAYVQEALLELCLPPWSASDAFYIFTTEHALKENYERRILRYKSESEYDERGLRVALEEARARGRLPHFERFLIKDGHSEEEIWAVFQAVFDRIEEGDHIYLDVTYGFRSLPMLAVVLLHYARVVKRCTVSAIYYGNYEAGREESKNKGVPEVAAPILNLNSLVELQEWTSAAAEFLRSGSAEGLKELTAQEALGQRLSELSRAIATCRGLEVCRDFDVDALKTVVAGAKANSSIEQQLRPLLDKIEEKMASFERAHTLKNGLAAVEWCLQHHQIQQGITFLKEVLTTHVIEQICGKLEITNELYRDMADHALRKRHSYKNSKHLKGKTEQEKQQIQEQYTLMLEYVKGKGSLSDCFKRFTSYVRNDINHCGFRDKPMSAEELEEDLRKAYEQIRYTLLPGRVA
jgi:CRISPR-associated Csx2 family protein